MPENRRNADKPQDLAVSQQDFDRAAALADTDQPSDAGFEDYDIDRWNAWLRPADSVPAMSRAALDSRSSTGVDWLH